MGKTFMQESGAFDDLLDQWETLCHATATANLEEFIAANVKNLTNHQIMQFRQQAAVLARANERLAAMDDTGGDLTDTSAPSPASQSTAALQPGGEPVASYKLVEPLGKGGFGEVWKAEGPGGFPVALKFVQLTGRGGEIELRSLEVIRDVRHPHLLSVFGTWQTGDRLVIAAELADCTLQDRYEECLHENGRGIPRVELLGYMSEAAKGIDFLNNPPTVDRPKIQHRDIKPQNLLLSGGSVKVGDFGLARNLQSDVTGHTGSLTVAYAAPEFLKGQTTTWSDQFSLAATYCYLAGGQLPFGSTLQEIVQGHGSGKPDLSMLDTRDQDTVARALSIEPASRWNSCAEFVDSMRSATNTTATPPPGSLDTTKPGPRLPRKGPWVRRSLRFAIAAALMLLVVTIGCLAMYYGAGAIAGALNGASYKRGYGDTVVTYSDRSYKGAKWEKVTDKVIARNGEWGDDWKAVTGWDENCIWLLDLQGRVYQSRNGQWTFHADLPDRTYNAMRLINADNVLCASVYSDGVFRVSAEGASKISGSVEIREFAVISDKLQYLLGGVDAFPDVAKVTDNNVVVLRENHAERFLHDVNGAPLERYNIGSIRHAKTLKAGDCGGLLREHKLVRFREGLWYEAGDVEGVGDRWIRDVWYGPDLLFAILVGQEGCVILKEREKPSLDQTIKQADAATSLDLIAVWGSTPQSFFVMDRSGTVWRRQDSTWRIVVPGMYDNKVEFVDAWVSPKGTVFAVSKDAVYRLK